VKEDMRVELLAIPLVAVIFRHRGARSVRGDRGPWAWILVGLGLLLLLALIVWRVTKRYPHMWDEAPTDDARRRNRTTPASAAALSRCL
jgi:hypothetical protein